MRFYSFSFMFLVVLFLQGCSFKLVAPYDVQAQQSILKAATQTKLLYESMQNTQEDKRVYALFQGDYLKALAYINTLVLQNSARKLNTESTQISEILYKTLKKYQQKHQSKNSYKTALLSLDEKRLMRMFTNALKAEKAKQ